MNAQIGLTVKIVDKENTCLVGAISVEVIHKEIGMNSLRIETGEDGPRREAHSGIAYILNAQGKTVDIYNLGPAPTAETVGS